MAIYHLHVGFVSRSSGRSAVQSAAYICGENLHEERRNKTADYTRKASEVEAKATLVPERSKYKGLEVWNAAENFEDCYAERHCHSEETRNNYLNSARTARTVVVALPNELSVGSNRELLEKFIKTRFVSRGLISTYAIHNIDNNMHAHIQVSMRGIGEDGDFVNRKDREICTRSALLETRKLWADLANEFLERDGFRERITEKSFEDLGINLEATKHRGWYADTIGTDSRIAQENLEIARKNEEKLLQDPSIVLDSLNATKATFTQRDILNEITKRVVDEKNISVIFEKALESAKYVGENIKGEQLYTGENYEQLESDTLTKFEEVSSKVAKIVCEEKTILSVFEKYSYLSGEQKSAVMDICGDRNFDILVGKAGAGKTTTMRAISEIYERNGARVVGMSLSAIASENLGKDAEIESKTIASWTYSWRVYENAKEKFLSFDSVVTEGVLKQFDWYRDMQKYESGQLKKGDVIIVDEAGMVGTSDWKNILDAAEKFGAKVIAVGDDNQFKPISSGDCFRQFVNQSKDRVCELGEIRRQKSEWQREASVEFSKMNVGAALEKYEHQGKIHELKDNRRVAERYLELEKLGTGTVLCSTNKECAAINDEIRSLKKERGELGADILVINGRKIAENDRIIFLRNDKKADVKNGQMGSLLPQAKSASVLKSSDADIVASAVGNHNLIRVQLDNGRIVEINTKEYDKIDHGYAITLHKSQGKTYDNTIVLANKMMDAKAFYVAMTRHRDNVDLYYNKSDFGSFRDLVNSASKYAHKDSLEDYRSIENKNKSRVFEYKETLMEIASVLKEIGRGEADWKEYHALKSGSVSLGREILSNYESHKLYLEQLGITKEKLEINVGLKQRPLSNAELNAKNTVELYAKTAEETRSLYQKMKRDVFNIKEHGNYDRYTEIRGSRDELAKEILSNYPLHREFVNQFSRECFISKKAMESQVTYANQRREQAVKNSEFEATARKEVGLYAQHNSKTADLYGKMKSEVYNISKHPEYEKYKEVRELRNNCAERIFSDFPMYKKVFEEVSAEQKISFGQLKSQVKYFEQAREQEAKLKKLEPIARKEVMSYVDYNNQSRILYEKIQREQGVALGIKSHPAYGKYSQIRAIRNELAQKIVGDYPSYKNIVDSLRSEYGISKTWMENQLKYAEKTGGSARITNTDGKDLEQYKYCNGEASKLYKEMRRSQFDITKHRDYGNFREISDQRNEFGMKILSNFTEVEEQAKRQNISRKQLENQIQYAQRRKQNLSISVLSSSVEFFRKLEEGKQYPMEKATYDGSTVADRMVLDRRGFDYERKFAQHLDQFGYGSHVSKSMMYAYCGEKGLYNGIHSGTLANEYASVLVQRKMEVAGMKKPTLEIVEDSIKHALCFQALKNASGIRELTSDDVLKLHFEASILAERISKENLHILNDDRLMREGVVVLEKEKRSGDRGVHALSPDGVLRLVEVNAQNVAAEITARNEKETAKTPSLETIQNCEIGR
jgi:ATP-dependent exoDNAse (exonuclease V) alpha subunit